MAMKRISFLRTLMLLGAAPKLVVTGMAEPEAVAAPLRSDLVYGGFIRGLRYYDYRKVHRKLKKGTLVDLRREPDNPHDRYAIEVWFGEHKLGYLPRAENKTLSHLLDLGLTFETQIRYVDPDKKNVWDGVYVKVFGEVGKVAEGDGVGRFEGAPFWANEIQPEFAPSRKFFWNVNRLRCRGFPLRRIKCR